MSQALDQLKTAIDADLTQSETIKALTDRVSKLEAMLTPDAIALLMVQAINASATPPDSSAPAPSGTPA